MCVTSCAQRLATCVNASARPIFLDEHGTWTATLSRTLVQSSLSSRKCLTKSTGSYRENLRNRLKGSGLPDDDYILLADHQAYRSTNISHDCSPTQM